MGEEKLTALLQESLHAATRTGAARPADFTRVIVDTTVQPQAIAFPTDAKLMHRTRARLVRLAHKHGVVRRQSSARVGKIALIRHQRYAHAKQFKRATRALRSLRTMLGRVIRDITRKIVGRVAGARNDSSAHSSCTACVARITRKAGIGTKHSPGHSAAGTLRNAAAASGVASSASKTSARTHSRAATAAR